MIRLGIDLGGTAVKYGLVENGRILCMNQVRTPLEEGYEAVLDTVAGSGKQMLETCPAEEIGLAVPGLVSTLEGKILFSNNFFWENKPVARDLARRFGLPVRMANDAQAAALGEALFGAGRGYRRVAMITVGTGVGGGFVRNGELEEDLYGGMAFIFGHLLYRKNGKRCNCGRTGCYEAYASAKAVEEDYREISGQVREAREIFASVSSDPFAQRAVDAFAEALGALAADIANAFRPEIIAVGGGISGAADVFLPSVRRALPEQVYGGRFAPVRVVQAALGNRAGIIGAASLNTRPHRGDEG